MGPGRQGLTSDAFPDTLPLGTNKRRLLFKVKTADNEEQQILLEKKSQKPTTLILTQIEPPSLSPNTKYRKTESSKELCDTD